VNDEELVRAAARRGFLRDQHARLVALVGVKAAHDWERRVLGHSHEPYLVLQMIMDAYRQGQAKPAGPVYSRREIMDAAGFRPRTRFVDIGPGQTPDSRREVRPGSFEDKALRHPGSINLIGEELPPHPECGRCGVPRDLHGTPASGGADHNWQWNLPKERNP
jgi:hypothetical protein